VSARIEDYAVIGDTHTAALVGRDASIDWLCLPRFDSMACFAKLLGDERNGYWRIAPAASPRPGTGEPMMASARQYRGNSLVLETTFTLPEGSVTVTDAMPVREDHPEIVRIVECTSGRVEMRMDLSVRFNYGKVVPWVRRVDGLVTLIAGPGGIAIWTPVDIVGENMTSVARFTLTAGERVPFVLSWYASHLDPPRPVDADYAVRETSDWWEEWVTRSTIGEGRYREAVIRSAITLKALTYAPTGGIVAAVTTSLPEALGGSRNWDYRYCWLRDATLTLSALMAAGYHDEALAWRDWLLRAVAGDPSELQIMYGCGGERSLNEAELPWLSGYENSSPVRIGNAAAGQFQLDVYGEVISALHESRRGGLDAPGPVWDLEKALLGFLETGWKEPDDGIWEVRGPRRHFTHSKVMAWVALDRAVQDIEQCGLEGPIDRWRGLRDTIHAEVCANGFDTERNTFTQYYGSKALDASTLMIPMVGFLPPHDPRVIGTVEAVEKHLTQDGFVLRYDAANAGDVDGLSGREGAFLACSFWLADNLELIGRHNDAITLFDRLLALRNDVGLLAEEYDPTEKRLVGNFPQAFSHISLVNTAVNLSGNSLGAADNSQTARLADRPLPPVRTRRARNHFSPSLARRHPHH
jgi:GH15 family glucan-1,4-alpha-glucosidase